MIEIVKYQKKYQMEIDAMLANIALEFEKHIYSKETEDTPLVPDVYWVALYNSNVIGTVGLALQNNYAILKRLFLKKEFRGQKFSLSNKLLLIALTYCVKNNIPVIYLGTMNQFIAAQRFYIKHGFHQILKKELPHDFMLNPSDDVFFKKLNITQE